jgi:hypothetical protein
MPRADRADKQPIVLRIPAVPRGHGAQILSGRGRVYPSTAATILWPAAKGEWLEKRAETEGFIAIQHRPARLVGFFVVAVAMPPPRQFEVAWGFSDNAERFCWKRPSASRFPPEKNNQNGNAGRQARHGILGRGITGNIFPARIVPFNFCRGLESIALTALRLGADCTIIAFIPGAELWRVFAEILQAGVHPVDADARLREILFAAEFIQVRSNALELFRHTLLAASGGRFCLLVKRLRQADAVGLVDRRPGRCGNRRLFYCGRGLMPRCNTMLPVLCRN